MLEFVILLLLASRQCEIGEAYTYEVPQLTASRTWVAGESIRWEASDVP